MDPLRPYDHPAREHFDQVKRRRECWACGAATTGDGSAIRHEGEAIRMLIPASGHGTAVREAFDIAQRALRDRPDCPARMLTDADRARIVVEALYLAGALRGSRGSWRRPGVCHAA